jgi:diguanylate cyclase (GGDEF)-like protein
VSDLVPVRAAIALSWERGPTQPLAMFRFGECRQSDAAIRSWAKESGLWNSVPPEPLVRGKGDRTLSLSGDEEVVQASFGIATPEMLYGLVVIESSDSALADPEMLNLLQLLVKETAVSLQDQLYRTELLSEKQESERNIQTLNRILSVSESLLTSTDADAILNGVAHAIRDALGSNFVLIALSDDSGEVFVPRAQAGLDEIWNEIQPRPKREITQYFTRDFAVAGCYFVPFKNLWSDDSLTFIREGSEGLSLQDWNSLDMILVPLVDENQNTIGYISVRERGGGRAPGMNRIRALEIFGRQIVAALRSASHYKAIEQLTRIDSLTQVFNRRHFHEKLRDEIQRHQRHGRTFALLMADIDDFKLTNDTYGHQAGDDVLKQVAEEISRSLREIDVVSRFGGEEFAVILPEAALESATDVAERLRESIANRLFTLRRGGSVRVTVSCGVAVFPNDAATQIELIAKADAALYVAKKRGKNQVIVA